MRCEDISTQLVDYLAGTLGEAGREALESHARSCETCRAEIEGLSQAWRQLGSIPFERSDPAALRSGFDAMMAEHARMPATLASRAIPPSAALPPSPTTPPSPSPLSLFGRRSASRRLRGNPSLRPLLQACAAALLVVVGVQVGREISPQPAPSPDMRALRAEVRDLRQMVTLSLMQQQSASERLKGVSWSNQLDRPGNEVVAALIDTLKHDANVNVRLASIDALKRFSEREVVRSAAIQALDTQSSPLVQMALIDFVVETQERGALETLRRLSRDEMANEAVRARAAWGIDHLGAA